MSEVNIGLRRPITTTYNELPTKKVIYALNINGNELLEKVSELLVQQIIQYKGVNYSTRPYESILDSSVITDSITNAACPGFTRDYVKDYVEEDNSLSIYVLYDTNPPHFIVGTTITNKCNCIHISTLCSNKEEGFVDTFKPLIPGKKMMRTLQLVTMILKLPCIVLESLPGAENFYLQCGFLYLASHTRDGTTTFTLTEDRNNSNIIYDAERIPIMFWINPDYEEDTFTTDCNSDVTSNFINFYLDIIEKGGFSDVRNYTLKNLEQELYIPYDVVEPVDDDETIYDDEPVDDDETIYDDDDETTYDDEPDHDELDINSSIGQINYDLYDGQLTPQSIQDSQSSLGLIMNSPQDTFNFPQDTFNSSSNMSQLQDNSIGLSRKNSVMTKDRKKDFKSGINPEETQKKRIDKSLKNRKDRRKNFRVIVSGLDVGGGKSKRGAKRVNKRTRKVNKKTKKVKRKTRRLRRKTKKSKRRY